MIQIRPKDRKSPIKIEFGKIVRFKRNTLAWSQEKLAEESGLHFTYISSVERGERNIALENIYVIAKALRCSAKELMPDIT
jgi:transcriptional regulator with XRE-family HTH domain